MTNPAHGGPETCIHCGMSKARAALYETTPRWCIHEFAAPTPTEGEPETMTLREMVEFLWARLDDIDTADDSSRDNDLLFRNRTRNIQRRRFETGITTDGYTLTFPAPTVAGDAERLAEATAIRVAAEANPSATCAEILGDAETEELQPSVESIQAWLTCAKEIGLDEAIISVDTVEWILARLRPTPEKETDDCCRGLAPLEACKCSDVEREREIARSTPEAEESE